MDPVAPAQGELNLLYEVANYVKDILSNIR